MSVQTEIDRIITAVGDAYDAIGAKGGTVPADETVANLGEAVRSIPTGTAEPVLQEKTVTYTANGTATITPDEGYDGLSNVYVTVDVSGGGGIETCTLTTKVGRSPDAAHGTIYAYDGGTLITITSKGTYSINKNSLIYIYGSKGLDSYAGLEIIKETPAAGVTGTKLCNVTSDIATYTFY